MPGLSWQMVPWLSAVLTAPTGSTLTASPPPVLQPTPKLPASADLSHTNEPLLLPSEKVYVPTAGWKELAAKDHSAEVGGDSYPTAA